MSDQIENVRKFARRAAIAAVMSRNLAHNTGSHKAPWVKFFISNRLERIHDYLEKGSLEELPKIYKDLIEARRELERNKNVGDEDMRKTLERTLEEISSEANLINAELLYYFDFFNSSMEFIADLTTTFDNERGSFEISTTDLIQEFAERKYIQSGLVDDYYYLDNSPTPKIKVSYNNHYPAFQAKLNIPNGHLGRVAFLIIFENIVRNVYKHSKIEKNINLWFRFDHFNEDYLSVDVFEKNEQVNEPEILQRINLLINDAILTKDHSLRQEGWGLFEMKICAAYLVDFPLDYIDQPVGQNGFINTPKGQFLPLLTANFYNDGNQDFKISTEGKCLGYRFYLKRPKKIFIDKSLIDDENAFPIDSLKKEGIVFGDLDKDRKHQFNIYELVLAPLHKTNLIDENQRFLFVDDSKYLFELENNNGVVVSYLFTIWLGKVISGRRVSEIGNILWLNYLRQKNYKIGHGDFWIAKNEEELKKLREGFPKVNANQIVVVDSHGKDISSLREMQFEDLRSFLWYIPEDQQILHTWLKDVLPDINYVTNFRKKLYFTEILNIQIGIFDERIQQETAFRYRNNRKFTISNLLALSAIHIPNYDVIDLTRITKETVDILEELLYNSLKSNHYTILHYTIFESMARNRGFKNNIEGLLLYYNQIIKDSSNRLVFCSGRGRPSNLIDGCYYLHLSTLRDILIRIRSKYHLVHALKSLRKTFNTPTYA